MASGGNRARTVGAYGFGVFYIDTECYAVGEFTARVDPPDREAKGARGPRGCKNLVPGESEITAGAELGEGGR